jgi:4,5-dihydroxyphthalate decarboxylase
MSDIKLKIGAYSYDQVRALFDGSVKIDGVDATFATAKTVDQIFKRMIKDREFNVSELGWTYYLRTLDYDEPPFIALPVFLARVFRHSAIYINTSSGIEKPQDLAGKTIGEFAIYGHDGGFWPKGILTDDFGWTPDQSRWVVGGLDWPMEPIDFIPFLHPANVEVTRTTDELGSMLEAGKIDALISADVPRCILNNSPKVARLFPDFKEVESEYYRRTGIFPSMHIIVVERDILTRYPDVVARIYKAFCDSKNAAMERYRFGRVLNHIDIMFPWFSRLVEEDLQIFPEDWWPYGVKANRKVVDTLLRYHYEQGLSKRRLTCEEVFVPELLGT